MPRDAPCVPRPLLEPDTIKSIACSPTSPALDITASLQYARAYGEMGVLLPVPLGADGRPLVPDEAIAPIKELAASKGAYDNLVFFSCVDGVWAKEGGGGGREARCC